MRHFGRRKSPARPAERSDIMGGKRYERRRSKRHSGEDREGGGGKGAGTAVGTQSPGGGSELALGCVPMHNFGLAHRLVMR